MSVTMFERSKSVVGPWRGVGWHLHENVGVGKVVEGVGGNRPRERQVAGDANRQVAQHDDCKSPSQWCERLCLACMCDSRA